MSCFRPQREYEEFKVNINRLVAKAEKVPEEGWTMQDGTPWPGNSVRDHPGMIQVGDVHNRFSSICGFYYEVCDVVSVLQNFGSICFTVL